MTYPGEMSLQDRRVGHAALTGCTLHTLCACDAARRCGGDGNAAGTVITPPVSLP